jgi:uncharacterized membrane protein YccF (DUF307 family)
MVRPQGGAFDALAETRTGGRVRLVLNIIWLVLAGLWLAIGYFVAAVVMFILIITIPIGVQAVKLAIYALWPFGRMPVPSPTRNAIVSVIGNILWFVLAGWWLALGHLFTGILLCLTIIGIPLGVANFKMAGAALVPFGKVIVSVDELRSVPQGAVVIDNDRAAT